MARGGQADLGQHGWGARSWEPNPKRQDHLWAEASSPQTCSTQLDLQKTNSKIKLLRRLQRSLQNLKPQVGPGMPRKPALIRLHHLQAARA